jgi:histidinol phosphatase-like enzyme
MFPALVQQIAYPALMALGQIPDPRSGERILDLDLAKETINLLAVLEKKTAGNRDPEEDKMIRDLLRDLQMAYTQTAQAAAQQAAADQASGNPAE